MGTGRPTARRNVVRRNIARRSNAPRVPFALLVAGLLIGGLVLLLALNTASAANELRRSALAGKDQEVSVDVAQLRNEVAASAAPGNLAAAAQQLGMVPAGHPAFIVELPNGRTVLRGHARAVADDPLDIPTGTQHASPSPTTRAAGPNSSATATGTPTSTATSTPTDTATSTATGTSTATSTSTATGSSTAKHREHHAKHRSGRAAHAAHTAHTVAATPTDTSSSTGGHA